MLNDQRHLRLDPRWPRRTAGSYVDWGRLQGLRALLAPIPVLVAGVVPLAWAWTTRVRPDGEPTRAGVWHGRMFTPPEQQRSDDHQFTAFLTRRPAFELALRRTVEATDGIDLCDNTAVTGLLVDDSDSVLAVRGVRIGEEQITADVVIDAGGRRSPVRRWLADVGVEMPERVQDCELTYHSRHFALRPDSELELAMLILLRFNITGLTSITFPGEHRTFKERHRPATRAPEVTRDDVVAAIAAASP